MMTAAASAAVMAAASVTVTASAAMVLMGEKLRQQGLPAAGNDDVVVADGLLEEVVPCQRGLVELQDDLAAAEIGFGEIADEASLRDERLREVA